MGYTTSNILPPTSIRDVIALILILNCFPRSFNGLIFIFYTLSGSTKVLGGKLFTKALSIGSKQQEIPFNFNMIDYSKMFITLMQLISIGLMLSLAITSLSNYKLLYYIDLLAKTIVTMDWIGVTNNYQTAYMSTIPNLMPQDNLSDMLSSIYNDKLVKFVWCYVTVLCLEYLKYNLNMATITDIVISKDFSLLFSSDIFLRAVKDNCNDVPVKSIKQWWEFSNQNIIRLIYFEFCMNVILIKFHSIFSIIGLKSLSNNLDQLNNLSPNIPIAFQKKPKNDPRENNNTVLKNDTINLEKKTVNIAVSKNIANSKCIIKPSSSTSAKNFETFVFKLFSAKNKLSSYYGSGIKLNKTSPSAFILDQNVSMLQPFWSLLAVVKLIKKIPNLFQGKPTTRKNNRDQYLLDFHNQNSLKYVIEYVGDCKVLFKVIDGFNSLDVIVNGVWWEFFEIVHNRILIYALSPGFQYEIKLSAGQKMSNIIINTTRGDKVLVESVKISLTLTLKYSILSTLDSIEKLKEEIKDFKRDENRRQAERKKNNDVLREKISKAKAFYESHLRKLKGAQQSIQQHENDVIVFDNELKVLETDNKIQDAKIESLKNNINEIKMFIDVYKKSIEEFNLKLKACESEKNLFLNKLEKTHYKIKEVENDIVSFNDKIDDLIKSICLQLRKKSSGIDDKFDTILAKLKSKNDQIEGEIIKLTK